jgi:TonB-linked SusC/RagA family outer membrane protein
MKKKLHFSDLHWSGLKKLLLVMKLASLFMFFTVMATAASTYSHVTFFDLNVKNATIVEVFDKIEKVTEFGFLFKTDQLDLKKHYDLDIRNSNIEQILSEILSKDQYSYIILDRNIVIMKNSSGGVQNEKQNAISGRVTDSTGIPLTGVTVLLKGTNTGTVTDLDGKFTFNNVPLDGILIFSFVGMNTQEIKVEGKSTIDIIMTESTIAIGEVVAIGYGTLSVRKVSGSITNVTAKDFNKGASQNAADLLQGRVAGLTITNPGGDVTTTQTIRLRGTSSLTGSSSPFVVIDGVPGLDINSVAPDDIESISVLKDASATAIYGSRSASGVILITTKKGRQGQTNITYSNYVAADVATRTPEVLTAQQWRDYTASHNMDVSGLDKGANTNWFDEITRTGISQNHNLSLSGGMKNGGYRISLNYLDRQGVMIDNYLKRYNGLISVNQKALNDKLNITLIAGVIQSDFQPNNTQNSVYAYNMLPVYPVKNPDGTYFDIQEWDQGNPVNNMKNNSNLHKTSQLYTNAKVDLEIFKGFTAGINLFKQRKSEDVSLYNASTTVAGRQDHGYAKRENMLWDKNLLEATLEYARTIQKHDFKILGGYSFEENVYQQEGAANRGFISDIFTYNNLSLGENLYPTDVSSYKSSNKLISFFGRVNYSFDDKYMFTATLRQDGSSKFGENHKWGLFPSASVAWRISDEAFIKNIGAISDLKLRVGYGIVGNQDGIDPYKSLALYDRGSEYFDNGRWHNTYLYSQNHNPNLKWEQTATFNPGIDFGFFANRITGSIDYYIKKTSDLLYVYNVPVPPHLYSTMLANVGDMENKGYEVVINGKILNKNDFSWTASVNFAHNKNVITRLSNENFQTDNIKTGNVSLRGSGYLTSSIIEEGQEVGTFYNLKCNGIDENGKFIIEDINPDGQINNDDYTYIGHAMPKLTYGILNSFSYKKIDLTFFFRGLYGNDVLNTPRIQYSNAKWLPGGNVLEEATTNGITDDPLFSSYYIESGSFLRLENVNLAYNFNLHNALGINKFRVFISGQNLFLITKFKGLDPEVNMDGLSPGVMDIFYVPKARTLSAGLEISF